MLYDEWFVHYLATYKRKLKPRTIEEYERMHRRYLSPVLGALTLEAITPEHVQLCVNAAEDSGSRQAQAVYSLIHAVMRRACRSRLILWSPVEAIDKPEHEGESGKQLTDADLDAVMPFVLDDLALSLALFAGLRRGEIAGMIWRDVDLAAGVLHVHQQRQRVGGELLTTTPKSSAGVRDVPIAPELLPILRRCYRLHPSARLIQTAPEAVGKRWAKIQERSVLLSQHYRLHDLRHTYGSRLILAGCNLRVVQYLMGHSSLEVTTRTYSHCSADQAAREARRVYAQTLH